MERNQEEARRKKMARLSTSSYVGGGVFVISQSPSSSDVDAGSPNVDRMSTLAIAARVSKSRPRRTPTSRISCPSSWRGWSEIGRRRTGRRWRGYAPQEMSAAALSTLARVHPPRMPAVRMLTRVTVAREVREVGGA